MRDAVSKSKAVWAGKTAQWLSIVCALQRTKVQSTVSLSDLTATCNSDQHLVSLDMEHMQQTLKYRQIHINEKKNIFQKKQTWHLRNNTSNCPLSCMGWHMPIYTEKRYQDTISLI